jgi:hypothetical protein
MTTGHDDLEVTAYHEAGHAVVAWACDIGVKMISLIPSRTTGSVKFGCAEFEYADEQDAAFEARDPIFIDRMILTGLGGPAAEYRHSPTTMSANQNDKRMVLNLLSRIGRCTEQDYTFYWNTTLEQICLPDIWSIVEHLAQILTTSEVLTALQMDSLLEYFSKSTPKFPPDFWQRLEANCLRISSPGGAI